MGFKLGFLGLVRERRAWVCDCGFDQRKKRRVWVFGFDQREKGRASIFGGVG